MRKFFNSLIILYQNIFSPDTGVFRGIGIFSYTGCAFYPRCSEYSKEAVKRYGFFRGIYMSLKRITKCHPWQKNHIDEV